MDAGRLWPATLALTLTAALGAVAVGAIIGTALMQLPNRFRLPMLGILSIPALLPNYVWAIAWSGVLLPTLPVGRGGAGFAQPAVFSTVWVWIATLYPWALGFTYLALRLWSPRLIEIAYACGMSPRRERALKRRLLVGPLAVALLVVWLITVSDFAVPDYFRLPLFANDVFVRVSSYLDPSSAARAAWPLLVMTLGLGLWIAGFSRTRRWIDSTVERTTTDTTAQEAVYVRSPKAAIATILVAVLICIGIPIASLGFTAGTMGVLRSAWPIFFGDAATSLGVAGLAVLIATALGTTAGYSLAHERKATFLPRILPALTFAVPSSLLGLVAISLTNRPGWAGLFYTSGGALVAALVVKYLIITVESARAQFSSLAPALEEIAVANGVSPCRTACAVSAPLAARGLVFGAAIFGLLVMNDLTLPSLIAPPGLSTLPLTVFSTVHYGPASLLAALCLWQIGLVLLLWTGLYTVAIKFEARRI